MKKFLNKVFKLEENNTTIKTEIIAGITTFFAMCYILITNPNQMTGFYSYLGAEMGALWSAIYVGTIVAAVIGTLLYAFLAKKPFAQASGMGINAFLVYTLLLNGTGLTYANCMMFTLLEGLVFVILTVT